MQLFCAFELLSDAINGCPVRYAIFRSCKQPKTATTFSKPIVIRSFSGPEIEKLDEETNLSRPSDRESVSFPINIVDPDIVYSKPLFIVAVYCCSPSLNSIVEPLCGKPSFNVNTSPEKRVPGVVNLI